jgi:hypothetical protein
LNTGSNVYYHSSTDKYLNNWYISYANSTSSAFVFKYVEQIHTSNGWITVANDFFAMNFYKMTKYTTKMTETEYYNGKLHYSQTKYVKSTNTTFNDAKALETVVVPSLKKSL